MAEDVAEKKWRRRLLVLSMVALVVIVLSLAIILRASLREGLPDQREEPQKDSDLGKSVVSIEIVDAKEDATINTTLGGE